MVEIADLNTMRLGLATGNTKVLLDGRDMSTVPDPAHAVFQMFENYNIPNCSISSQYED